MDKKKHPHADQEVPRPHQGRGDEWRNEDHNEYEGNLLGRQRNGQRRVRVAMPQSHSEMDYNENSNCDLFMSRFFVLISRLHGSSNV